jgi:hypothetical protein
MVSTGVLAPASSVDARRTYVSRALVVAADVRVMNGRLPVTGLAADDFTLLDNSVPQSIDAVEIGTVPLDVTVVLELDDATVSFYRSPTRWGPAQVLADAGRLGSLLGRDDRLRVLRADAQGVFELRPLAPGGAGAAARYTFSGGRPGSRLYDAVLTAMLETGSPGRRQLILVYTDGIDGLSVTAIDKVSAIADVSDAVVHVARRGTITDLIQQRQTREVPWQDDRWLLVPVSRQDVEAIDAIAYRTGGTVWRPGESESLVTAVDRVLSAFRKSYVLYYRPSGVSDPGWHTIEVRLVTPGGARIDARRGYFWER